MIVEMLVFSRKELSDFYIKYLKTHTYIKHRDVAWRFLIGFSLPYNLLVKRRLALTIHHKLKLFSQIAVKIGVLKYYCGNNTNVFKILNRDNLKVLKHKLNKLKEYTYKIPIS